jgi:hypothetical protein
MDYKKIISIKNASVQSGISETELIKKGADGSIILSVYKPLDHDVRVIHKPSKQFNKSGNGLKFTHIVTNGTSPFKKSGHGLKFTHIVTNDTSNIVLLNLSREDCKNILEMDDSKQYAFKTCFSMINDTLVLQKPSEYISQNNTTKKKLLESGGHSSIIQAYQYKKLTCNLINKALNIDISDDYFAAYNSYEKKDDPIITHTLRMESIYITASEFQRISEMETLPKDRFVVKEYHTDELVYLNQVAREMWAIYKKNKKYPSEKDVQKAFAKKLEGEPSNAKLKYGAMTIRPPDEELKRSKKLNLPIGDDYITKDFQTLAEAARIYWENGKRDGIAIVQQKVADWLEDHGFGGTHAKIAAAIINNSKKVQSKKEDAD